MRIAVLTSSFPRFKGDGTAPFVKSISEAVANLGNEVQVLAPYDKSLRDDLESTVKVHRFKYVWPKSLHIMGHARTLQADVKLHPLTPLLLPLFLFAEIINLIRLSKKMDAQVIHAHWVLPNGFAAAVVRKLLGIPLVISLHGSDIFMADKNFMFRAIARWTFKQSSAVTACSQELYDRAKRIHKNIDIHLIAWGADPDMFKPLQNRRDVRETYGWASDEIIISTLGRMVYKKGFSHLIDIVPELISGDRKIKVVIGGSGPLEEELKEKVQQMGISDTVSFPGRIPWNEAPQFLAASDIFVLPSQRDKAGNLDGLPTVLLEAMACGLPCVASDIGGVSLVINQGKNGFIFNPTDFKKMESELKTLIQDKKLREKLGIKSRVNVVTKYNWINVAKSIENLYKISITKNIKLRLEQQYRLIYLQQLKKNYSGKRALDIGCHDPEWLNLISANEKAGIDLKPKLSFPDFLLTQADGFSLPFSKDYFDVIFMLDVIEHVENDSEFICEAQRVLKPGGKLVLTTPSIDIKVFPSFFTGWISKKWGHYFRRGYSPEELENLFIGFNTINIIRWKAQYFLKYYFILRFLFTISPSIVKRILTKVVNREMKQPYGSHGFLVLTATK